MREEFGARNPKSMMLRFHTQTAGVQLTAQQPEVNIIRVTTQALAAVLGGSQSLHTNSFDEAIALPSEKAARLAVRTQQVLAYETDLTATVDPFAGSYAVEAMTDEVERVATELIEAVEKRGGAVAAIEQGFQKTEIEKTAYGTAREIEAGERVVVGVNRYRLNTEEPYEPLRPNPELEREQAQRLDRLRAERSSTEVDGALDELRRVASAPAGRPGPEHNVLYPMRRALAAHATVGEVCHALREVWGAYVPNDAF
jgi:methylmalonyl-CoA mutase N-terminal domain/subunit